MLVKRRVVSVPPTWAGFAGEGNAYIMTLHAPHPDAGAMCAAAAAAANVLPTVVSLSPRDAQLTVQTNADCAMQLACCQMNANAEELLAADVNGAGVVACLVRPSAFYRQLQAVAQPAEDSAFPCAVPHRRVLFFAGRERLGDCPCTALSAADDKDGAVEYYMQPALHCLRLPSGASAAVCAVRPDVLWLTSTVCGASQQEHVRTFAADTHVECTGAGRGELAEVMVVLSDRSVALYGVREGTSATPPRSRAQACADLTATSPSEESSRSGGDWVMWENETRMQPDAHTTDADVRTSCTLVEITKVALPDVGAPVRRVCWSGRHTLWLIHDNGTVLVLRDANASTTAHDDTSEDGDTRAPQLHLVQSVTLPQWIGDCGGDGGAAAAIGPLWVCPDTSHAIVHIAVQDTTTSDVLYGTLRLTNSADSQADVAVVLYRTALAATVYGLRVVGSRHRYQLLTQGVQGRSALYIITVPRDTPCACSTTSSVSDGRALCRDIATATTEAQLFDYCHRCEATIVELDVRHAAATDPARGLARLRELHDAARALLRRELKSTSDLAMCDVDSSNSNSYPRRLLRRIAERRRELLAYALLAAVHALDDGDAPLAAMLQLTQARAARQHASAGVVELMRQSSPTLVLSDEGDLVPDDAALSDRLCIDHMLATLGVPGGAASTSLTELITRWPAPARVMALLVLYCSHRDCLADTMNASDWQAAQERDALREAFLRECDEPATLNAWAFVTFAVDHNINPAATISAASSTSDAARDEEAGSEAAANDTHRALGMLAHHLADPPLLALLPPLITGLIASGGFDVALRSLCTMLPWLTQPAATQTGTSAAMPWGPLLYLALQGHAVDIVQMLFVFALDTQDSTLRVLATRALAYAALQRGDVSPLRGLVQAGTNNETQQIEKVLTMGGGGDVASARRERVLLQYYIATRRFATALRLCEAISAKGGAAVEQRLQSVASCLRSLLASTPTMNTAGARADVGDFAARATDTVLDTPLELSTVTLEATASLTIARLRANSLASAPRSTLQSCHTACPSRNAVLRPSNIPLSLLVPASEAQEQAETSRRV